MYQLQDIGNSTWKIQKKGSAPVQGTLSEVADYMVGKLDMYPCEIEIAIEEMRKSRHTTAEFGVLKCFIFTANPDFSQFN